MSSVLRRVPRAPSSKVHADRAGLDNFGNMRTDRGGRVPVSGFDVRRHRDAHATHDPRRRRYDLRPQSRFSVRIAKAQATPPLVVARASNPASTNSMALIASQTFGKRSTGGPWCRARKDLARSLCPVHIDLPFHFRAAGFSERPPGSGLET
jgi:hypothetical protein